MQFSAFDLENHANLQMAERMRWAAAQRRLEEAREAGHRVGIVARLTDALRSAFVSRQTPRIEVEPVSSPLQLAVAPEPMNARPAAEDPYAGMVVIARGKEPCTLDAA